MGITNEAFIKLSLSAIFLILCCLINFPYSWAGDSGYHVINNLELGGEGGWDYLTVDTAARRLYISRGTHVMVVDIDTGKLVGDIADTPGVHGIAIAPELNRGFTSNGKADTASIFDLKTLKVISTVKTGENPDAILYDTATKRVFTFNGRGAAPPHLTRPPVRLPPQLPSEASPNSPPQTAKARFTSI